MLIDFSKMISENLSMSERYVENVLKLFNDGATIPFISRYRKEMTGGMDEVQITDIKNLYSKLHAILERKNSILSIIEGQGKLTEELKKRINDCWDIILLEDIYLPFKPKRITRAEIARQNGLEPLAQILIQQKSDYIVDKAKQFITDKVCDVESALSGAMDILAEWFNENERCRNIVRKHFKYSAEIKSKVIKGQEEVGIKYKDYYDFSESLKSCSSHRLLAIRRGESEGVLRVSITIDDEACLDDLSRIVIRGKSACTHYVKLSLSDAYKRLIKPSIETEFASDSKLKADNEAINVFAKNLHQLLLSPPLGSKRVLALDPGFRTGCKVVCLDAQGVLLHNETIYPHPPRNEFFQSQRKLQKLVEQYEIDAIAIGNGTAGRETEKFVQSIRFDRKVDAFIVCEDGASIYSASKMAREEFPNYDVTVRGAVSIGRRLMDPLAELVKIDPKSIGVGQYQYDVDQTKLRDSLSQTVESCVNSVGVNLNTASVQLLTYISGLGPQLAQNIVDYRNQNGPFNSRKELLKVPRMGEKTFEQCAGFLRITEGKSVLDNTSVHPERYDLVSRIAKDLNVTINELIKDKDLRNKIDLNKYVTSDCGLPTLNDIMLELDKPGRDPRTKIKVFAFDSSVKTIDDIKENMILPGVITNITNFGCFVDIGVHEKGLVHISQLADKYVSDPNDVVSLHQQVQVKVIQVDKERNRISLTLKI